MDPSIAIFVGGSCASFLAFYWAVNRHFAAKHARRAAGGRTKRYGSQKMSFLDGLRHEAASRAQVVLYEAVDHAERSRREARHVAIDADMLKRLGETRSMLQALLSRDFTSEFDRIVQILSAGHSSRKAELDAALERMDENVRHLARDVPRSQRARGFANAHGLRGLPPSSITSEAA